MAKTLREIFESIAKMYQDEVEQQDQAGFSELYYQAAQTLLAQLQNSGFHAIDVEYLDGYFIFGTGTNTILHFHITECPGWKFGVWWSEPEKGKEYITGKWFAQYEENIDKFKPSASVISGTLVMSASSDKDLDWGFQEHLSFIRDEPYLAFCRDYLYWDYNTEYHSREEAETEFNKWKRQTELLKEGSDKYRDLHFQLVTKCLSAALESGEELYILDRGNDWSPQYKYIVYSTTTEPGEYSFSDFEGWDECQQELDALEKSYRKQDVYIDTWVSHDYFLVTNEKVEECDYIRRLI